MKEPLYFALANVYFLRLYAYFIFLKHFTIQGFLSKNLQEEALGKLDKRIKTTVEQFMKVLEQVDSVVSKDITKMYFNGGKTMMRALYTGGTD